MSYKQQGPSQRQQQQAEGRGVACVQANCSLQPPDLIPDTQPACVCERLRIPLVVLLATYTAQTSWKSRGGAGEVLLVVPGACSVPPCCVAGDLGDASAPHSSVWAMGGVLQPVCQPNCAPCGCWQPQLEWPASQNALPRLKHTQPHARTAMHICSAWLLCWGARLQLNSFAAAGSACTCSSAWAAYLGPVSAAV